MKYFKKIQMVLVIFVAAMMMLGTTSITCVAGEIPYTFSPGQTISAAQVNANFQALLTQIAALQAQLEPVSIIGTYDYFSLGFGMSANVIKHKYFKGTLVFTADTVTVNGTGSTDRMVVSYDGNAGAFTTQSDPEIVNVAYTVTGSTVTFAASQIDDSGFVGTLSADKKILIGLWKNTSKGNEGTIVAIKRM